MAKSKTPPRPLRPLREALIASIPIPLIFSGLRHSEWLGMVDGISGYQFKRWEMGYD
jgi:hypothetical protein